jgi:hypothetical protein
MAFTPKKILVNGKEVAYIQSTLKTKLGNPEITNRVQVSGKSTKIVPAENLETKIAEVNFDVITSDSNSNADPRVLALDWSKNIGANQIMLIPDGVGKTQLYNNASLTNPTEVDESPDGVISLMFQSDPMILTD